MQKRKGKNKAVKTPQEIFTARLQRLETLKASIDVRIQATVLLSRELKQKQKQLTTDLLQIQRTLASDISNAHLQRRLKVLQLSIELRNRQEALTRQLISEQRQRYSELRQRSARLVRQQIELSNSLRLRR